MSKRTFVGLLLAVLLLSVAVSQAQEPGVLIDRALADLSARLGRTVGLSDLLEWRWNQQFYPDTSLGCPAEGQAYTQERTLGFQFLFTTSDGVTYDYRANVDGSVLFLCVEGRPAEGTGAPPAAAPTATQPLPAGTATPSLTATPGTAAPCDPVPGSGYLPPRLAVGAAGRSIDDGVPSNVRSEPSRSASVVVQIPAGERFTVLEGPVCNEGLVWWRVMYGNFSGWTAEGEDDTYWVEPLPDGRAAITLATMDRLSQLAVLNHAAPLSGNVAFSPDGALLAAGTEEGVVQLWGAAAGVQAFELAGHEGAITALAFNAAGTVLASADADGVVRLWNPALGVEQFALTGHEGAVTALAFNLDGSLLASGGEDGIVRLWNVAEGLAESLITAHTGPIVSLAFTADGAILASSSEDGTARLWGLPAE